ncbi:MAG: Gfo/Idh/MocA family oxidoreductase [Thermoanaerobaculia bacterium]
MIRIGLIGAGVFGFHHARVLSSIKEVQFEGIYDLNLKRAEEVSRQFGVPFFEKIEDLIKKINAVIIAVPTIYHKEVALKCALEGINALVEKPLSDNIKDGEEIVNSFREKNLILAVGHIERHNPVVEAVIKNVKNPKYITIERLATFSPRSLDVDVILDLMIHDIQIVMDILKNDLVDTKAVGIPVLSEKIDICNARLEFEGKRVASITASRISQERVRKLRIFEEKRYFSVDYAEKTIKAYELVERDGQKLVDEVKIEVSQQEPLRAEIMDFVKAIEGKKKPLVDGEKALRALKIAKKIQEAIC